MMTRLVEVGRRVVVLEEHGGRYKMVAYNASIYDDGSALIKTKGGTNFIRKSGEYLNYEQFKKMCSEMIDVAVRQAKKAQTSVKKIAVKKIEEPKGK